jgi:hypothetical protein
VCVSLSLSICGHTAVGQGKRGSSSSSNREGDSVQPRRKCGDGLHLHIHDDCLVLCCPGLLYWTAILDCHWTAIVLLLYCYCTTTVLLLD